MNNTFLSRVYTPKRSTTVRKLAIMKKMLSSVVIDSVIRKKIFKSRSKPTLIGWTNIEYIAKKKWIRSIATLLL